ncbi:MAG: hypothetical protein LUH82_06540 [Clostridiales bacterium]|nr:hypothetical protein [Clostridiales bacterium]
MNKENSVNEAINETAATPAAEMTKKEKKQAKKADKKAQKAAKKAKKKAKWKKLSPGKKFLKILAVILAVCIFVCGLVIGFTKPEECNYFFSAVSNAVTAINDGTWQDDVNGSGDTSSTASESTIGEFVAGTYGGVQFDTIEDVVNYYVAAYDLTKSETAQYIESDGSTATYYAFVGDEDLQIVGDVLVDGKSNSIINGLVPTIVGGLFSGNVYGLPPCSNRTPELDVDENGDSLQTSRLTVDDIQAATVTENADGTITMVLQCTPTEMSHKGLDSHGHMFNTLGAIDSTVDSISVLSWASGTTAENCKVTYENGTATVTIDPSTGKITEADYNMLVTVDVTHANVSVIKDKSATLEIAYVQHFPASDEYLMTSRNLTRA